MQQTLLWQAVFLAHALEGALLMPARDATASDALNTVGVDVHHLLLEA